MDEGGVCDLAEGSPTLDDLDAVADLESAAITASGGLVGEFELFLDALNAVVLFNPTLVSEHIGSYYFQSDPDQLNDSLVPVDSQNQEESITNLFDYQELVHSDKTVVGKKGVLAEKTVASTLYTLLDYGEVLGVSAFSNTLPDVITSRDGTIRTWAGRQVGRGDATESSNYSSQCGALSSPMRVSQP